jgi:hypothetical protein
MPNFNEAKSPLTSDHVQGWARATFAGSFRALPRPGKLKWMEIDDYRKSRPVFRSLGRSSHKQLLVIGGYAPGPEIEEEPIDQVVAHVHTDEAEVSFYRIAESVEDGELELQPVNLHSNRCFSYTVLRCRRNYWRIEGSSSCVSTYSLLLPSSWARERAGQKQVGSYHVHQELQRRMRLGKE